MANESDNSTSANAQREIEDLRRRLKELTDKYGPAAHSAVEDLERQIREKPVQATLIAAGVGFLLGALLSR